MTYLSSIIRTRNAALPKLRFSELKRRNFSVTVQRYENKNALTRLDPIELATGMYKQDILKRLSGQDDPYSVKMFKRGTGTKEQPNMIPSAFESRMVGCICEEDSDSIVWMWLKKGEPKRCQCGHWFQLYYEPPYVEDKSIPI